MDEVEYWHQRFVQYDTQARGMQTKVLEMVAIGLTAVTTLAGIAIAYSRLEFFAFIPVICILLWAIAARMIHEHLLLSAYRDYCEARASRERSVVASSFDAWRPLGGQSVMRGFANYYVFAILSAVTLGLVAGSLGFLFTTDTVPVGWLIAETIACAIALILGAVVFITAMVDHAHLESKL